MTIRSRREIVIRAPDLADAIASGASVAND